MGIFVGIGNYIGRVRQIGDGGGQPIGPNDYYIITEDGIAVLTERGKHILLDKYVTEDEIATWCKEHGISVPIHARRSLDGSEVILHEDFIKPVINNDEEIIFYPYDSVELNEILNSETWQQQE